MHLGLKNRVADLEAENKQLRKVLNQIAKRKLYHKYVLEQEYDDIILLQM